MKHTPGPWKATEQPNADIRIHSTDPVVWIAEMHYEGNKTVDESVRPEFEANARLIATAPEMLETLQQICKEKFPENSNMADLKREALRVITKARGL